MNTAARSESSKTETGKAKASPADHSKISGVSSSTDAPRRGEQQSPNIDGSRLAADSAIEMAAHRPDLAKTIVGKPWGPGERSEWATAQKQVVEKVFGGPGRLDAIEKRLGEKSPLSVERVNQLQQDLKDAKSEIKRMDSLRPVERKIGKEKAEARKQRNLVRRIEADLSRVKDLGPSSPKRETNTRTESKTRKIEKGEGGAGRKDKAEVRRRFRPEERTEKRQVQPESKTARQRIENRAFEAPAGRDLKSARSDTARIASLKKKEEMRVNILKQVESVKDQEAKLGQVRDALAGIAPPFGILGNPRLRAFYDDFKSTTESINNRIDKTAESLARKVQDEVNSSGLPEGYRRATGEGVAAAAVTETVLKFIGSTVMAVPTVISETPEKFQRGTDEISKWIDAAGKGFKR
jgi:hypothetical protein